MLPFSLPLQHRLVWAIALLPLFAAKAAAPQAASPVPSRALTPEMAAMKDGTPAYIHTHFATGAGFVLQSGEEVVTARHNVLTPTGELAGLVGVGIPQPPLNNIVERRAMPIAQDPAEDLVLLRLTGGAVEGVSPMTPAFQAVTKIAAAAPCSSAAALSRFQISRRKSRATVHTVHAASARATHPPANAATPAPVRIVWDGPAQAATAAELPHKAPANQARLRVVWDGPLRH